MTDQRASIAQSDSADLFLAIQRDAIRLIPCSIVYDLTPDGDLGTDNLERAISEYVATWKSTTPRSPTQPSEERLRTRCTTGQAIRSPRNSTRPDALPERSDWRRTGHDPVPLALTKPRRREMNIHPALRATEPVYPRLLKCPLGFHALNRPWWRVLVTQSPECPCW